jgi:hypothetical protein
MSNLGYLECRNCGKQFAKKRVKQVHCSAKCRMNHWLKMNPRVKLVPPTA